MMLDLTEILFTQAEERATGAPRVAIVDTALASRLFGSDSPLGRPIQYATRDQAEPPVVMTVVGVAPGLRDNLFGVGATPHLYVPFGTAFQSMAYLHIRTRAASAAAEAAMVGDLRRTVESVDPRVPILSIETQSTFRARGLMLAVVRVCAVIFTAFGIMALGLAALGIYGVKAYVVSRRTREIGIRVALGATPGRIAGLVVGEGLVTSVVGLAIGLGLSALAGLAMRSLTYQGRAADAAVLAVSFGVLVTAALVASWLPARRATRISPIRALRE